MVTIQNPDGSRKDVTNRLEIEQAILRNNYDKFSQSFHTLFYCSPLKEAFGFQGLSTAAQAVLAGVYDTDLLLDQFIWDVLAQWEKPEAIRQLEPIRMDLSLEQYRSFWLKANENISCYPSALSFSTMKAGAHDSDIAFLDWTLTKIPLEKGFAPK
jgi:hypothetical protein